MAAELHPPSSVCAQNSKMDSDVVGGMARAVPQVGNQCWRVAIVNLGGDSQTIDVYETKRTGWSIHDALSKSYICKMWALTLTLKQEQAKTFY